MNRKNPLITELNKLGIININNLQVINKKTRDRKINVLQDINSKVILLERLTTSKSYYANNKHYKKFQKNKKIKNFPVSSLNDESRRFDFLKTNIKNKLICDFGCGEGEFLKYACKFSKKVFGVEINQSSLNNLKNFEKIKVKKNLSNFKFNFDLITMFHVLEHLPNQVDILKKIKSKLNINGKIIIEVPHANDFLINEGPKEFKNFTFWSEHLVLHTRQSLKKILIEANFRNIKIHGIQRYNFLNHFGWFTKKKPNGHNLYKNLFDDKVLNEYDKFLLKYNYSDTLIAIAKN
ncbi:class I SAM-dependent methyltransferase [Candidatus Pelagibacter sp.]|uniref:class I SAM-dependent methyltransferase n=1 Tax=Candidatus Pelagibacter sp. TaxID=2024849 RepID=UPI003D0B342E